MFSFPTKLKNNRALAVGILATSVFLVLAFILFYFLYVRGRINTERSNQAAAAAILVRESKLRAPALDGISQCLNASRICAVDRFNGLQFIATSGGLIALDESGAIKQRYTTLDGLPDNDLTALAVFEERLFIGTATAGLLAFDGREFTHYQFEKPRTAHVTSLAAAPGRLLIGTIDGGLFEYDGARFTRRINGASGGDFVRVTALLPYESRIYIGTQDTGLYLWREATLEHISTPEGLPSPHVTGLVVLPPRLSDSGKIAVATDFGIVTLTDANEMKPLSSRPNITSLSVAGNNLWAGLFTGGVIEVNPESNARNPRRSAAAQGVQHNGLPASAPTTVFTFDGLLWALTPQGAFSRDPESADQTFRPISARLASNCALTGSHITALAFDNAGRLWVGYFDQGIDIVSAGGGELITHIADERVKEVNFIARDDSVGRMIVASSRGAVALGGAAGVSIVEAFNHQTGLVNDSVAHISLADADAATPEAPQPHGRALIFATAGGLTTISEGRSRSLTAFHGLASNHLYASATAGSRLYLGTLAGLVELEGSRVLRTLKVSNSRLSHDWVTALCAASGSLFIGTNGGGVDELLPTGEITGFSDEIGKFEVNQGALVFSDDHLYAGTTDRGLLIYNTATRRWTRINEGLTSSNVTAIAADDRFIYVGTLNGLTRIEKRAW